MLNEEKLNFRFCHIIKSQSLIQILKNICNKNPIDKTDFSKFYLKKSYPKNLKLLFIYSPRAFIIKPIKIFVNL